MTTPPSLKTTRVDVDFGAPDGCVNFDVYPRYSIAKSLGRGGYGFVVEATDAEAKEEKDKVVAIKKLPSIFRHENLTKSALREITMLKHFNHDNILSIKDIIIPLKENAQGLDILLGDVYLVVDKMDLDLGELLNTPTEIDVEQRRFFIYQILRGLKCIHSAQVLHRDLKPQNILINSSCDLKICDFGLARGFEAGGMTTNVTTQWYRAPEILLEMVAGDDAGEQCQYDKSVDIWSAGCIFAELMIRRPLFKGKANIVSQPRGLAGGKGHMNVLLLQIESVFDVLGTPDISPNLPSAVKEFLQKAQQKHKNAVEDWSEYFPAEKFDAQEVDLVKRMLRLNGAQRIAVSAALEHPYLADFHDPSDEPDAKAKFVFPYTDADLPSQSVLIEFADFHPEIRNIVKLPAKK